MAIRKNPSNLNPLQLRTLTVLQVLARVEGAAMPGPQPGELTISRFPAAHGDHLHFGDYVVKVSDATGLMNKAVWNALSRKGLARADWPHAITLTADGIGYDTALAQQIVFRGSH